MGTQTDHKPKYVKRVAFDVDVASCGCLMPVKTGEVTPKRLCLLSDSSSHEGPVDPKHQIHDSIRGMQKTAYSGHDFPFRKAA